MVDHCMSTCMSLSTCTPPQQSLFPFLFFFLFSWLMRWLLVVFFFVVVFYIVFFFAHTFIKLSRAVILYSTLYHCLCLTIFKSVFYTKQVELLKFEGEMLTDDGGILRRIKIRGDGYTNPNDGAWVDGMLLLFFMDIYWWYGRFFQYNKYTELQLLMAQIMIFVS